MRTKITILATALLLGASSLRAQLNVGSTSAPDASAQLQVSSTTKGLLMPKVSLTVTTTFGLAGNTQTAGIVVYNTNAGITGTSTYPASGIGLYAWDGTGWVKQLPVVSPTLPAIVFVGNTPTYSANVANNIAYNVPISTVYLDSTSKITLGGSTLSIVTAGTYMVEATMDCQPTAAESSNGEAYVVMTMGSNTIECGTTIAQITSGNNSGRDYTWPITYTAALAAGESISLVARTYGFGLTNAQFRLLNLKVTQIK